MSSRTAWMPKMKMDRSHMLVSIGSAGLSIPLSFDPSSQLNLIFFSLPFQITVTLPFDNLPNREPKPGDPPETHALMKSTPNSIP